LRQLTDGKRRLDTDLRQDSDKLATRRPHLHAKASMNTSSLASYGPAPATTNIWVSHSNALVTAGLVATMQRIRGCQVRSGAGVDDVRGAAAHLPIDLLIADSAALARSATKRQEAASNGSCPKPQIVLMTINDGTDAGPLPPGISASLPMDCAQDDLLNTVCGLIGFSLSTADASRSDRETPGSPPATAASPRGGIAPSALRRVREHIELNLGEHLDIDHLAMLTGLSACHFSRAFRQSMGVPPHRYLISRRVAAAATLVESTDRPLSEIALEVGFSDQSHFTRVFSAQIGESPRRFRHQHR
jgi:AraC-like DNA-binding protein